MDNNKKQLEKFLLKQIYNKHYDLYGLNYISYNGKRLTHIDLFLELKDLIKELDFSMSENLFSFNDWKITLFKKDYKGFSYVYSITITEEDREKIKKEKENK